MGWYRDGEVNPMTENRNSQRDPANSPPVSCWVELPDGTKIEGVVADISADGAKIHASKTILKVGMHVRVIFELPFGEKTAAKGEVKHIDSAGNQFGVKFESAPVPIEA